MSLMVWLGFIDVSQKLCLYHGINHKANEEDVTIYLDHRVLRSLGSNQTKNMETPILIPPNS
jgi:hypothetical protein